MKRRFLILFLILITFCLSALLMWSTQKDPAIQKALAAISATDFSRTDKTLSSDEYEGRAPASKGEELSTKFIEGEFKKIGLKPGNTDGTYFQKVPMGRHHH